MFPRGSEWRKWDLHVHIPGTGLANDYEPAPDGKPDYDRFCNILNASDVAAIGVTDYFRLSESLKVIERFRELHGDTSTLLLPNMELRLNEAVNGSGEEVNLHLIFPPELTAEVAHRFEMSLKTEVRGDGNRRLTCDQLTADLLPAATVSRESIRHAIEDTFGVKIERQDYLVVVTSCGNDGIRPERGKQRKESLTDEIDKDSDGFFGNSGSTNHFLKTDRLEEAGREINPKPVFGGCDAHSFAELEERLGKAVSRPGVSTEVTWVKADPTYQGLLQTFIEPSERVRIQPAKPDHKEPYQIISSVTFGGTTDFPEKIVFNQNLVSVIGSRSSGKSALLAYIAHAIDPDGTIRQQAVAAGIKEAETGPAAGKSWQEVRHIDCRVEWAEPTAQAGRVIYIPQNSLFAISNRPDEITSKISPVLFRRWPMLEAVYGKLQSDLESGSLAMRAAIERWFQLSEQIKAARVDAANLGDRAAVQGTYDQLEGEINSLRTSLSLTPEDVSEYQDVRRKMDETERDIKDVDAQVAQLGAFIVSAGTEGYATTSVRVELRATPQASMLPQPLAEKVSLLLSDAENTISQELSESLVGYRTELDDRRRKSQAELDELRERNADLIQRNEANAEIDELLKRQKKQLQVLNDIDKAGTSIEKLGEDQAEAAREVVRLRSDRRDLMDYFRTEFDSESRQLGDMTFGFESEVNADTIQALSKLFNKQENSDYVDRASQVGSPRSSGFR